MSRELGKLQNLMSVIEAGNEFYERSRVQTQDPALRAFFAENLAKGRALSRQLERYQTDLPAELHVEAGHVPIAHLEELESKILHAFHEALIAAASPGLQSVLVELQAEFAQVHDAIRAHQQSS